MIIGWAKWIYSFLDWIYFFFDIYFYLAQSLGGPTGYILAASPFGNKTPAVHRQLEQWCLLADQLFWSHEPFFSDAICLVCWRLYSLRCICILYSGHMNLFLAAYIFSDVIGIVHHMDLLYIASYIEYVICILNVYSILLYL